MDEQIVFFTIRQRKLILLEGPEEKGGRLLFLGFLVLKVPNFYVQNSSFKRNDTLVNHLIALVDVTDA